MAEILYDCPGCERMGFTHEGLRRHICPALGRQALSTDQYLAALEINRTMRRMAKKTTSKLEMRALREYLRGLVKQFPAETQRRGEGGKR